MSVEIKDYKPEGSTFKMHKVYVKEGEINIVSKAVTKAKAIELKAYAKRVLADGGIFDKNWSYKAI